VSSISCLYFSLISWSPLSSLLFPYTSLFRSSTLAGDVDVMYVVTDNTVVSALDSVVEVANSQGILLIVGEPDSLQKGGFATYGIDYYTIGKRTGEMAVEVLTGETEIEKLDVEYPPEIQLFINKEAAEAQNVQWNKAWDDETEFVEAELGLFETQTF